MVYFQKFKIEGVANKTTFDSGLESSKENPKRLLSVIVQISDYQENVVEGWWEKEKIFELYDKHLDTVEEGTVDKIGKSMNRINEIEVGFDIPIGSTFSIALNCGANTNDLIGAYRYEIVKG